MNAADAARLLHGCALTMPATALPGQENEAVAPAAVAAGSHTPADQPASPMVSIGSLVLKEHPERLSELVLVLVLMVGSALFVDSWS